MADNSTPNTDESTAFQGQTDILAVLVLNSIILSAGVVGFFFVVSQLDKGIFLSLSERFRGAWNGIKDLLTFRRSDRLLKEQGEDAAFYTLYNRLLVLVLLVLSIAFWAVLGPLYSAHEIESLPADASVHWFVIFSIQAIEQESDLLWVPAAMCAAASILVFVCVLWFQRHRLVRYLYSDVELPTGNNPGGDVELEWAEIAGDTYYTKKTNCQQVDCSHVSSYMPTPMLSMTVLRRKVAMNAVLWHNLPRNIRKEEQMKTFVMIETNCIESDIVSCTVFYDVRRVCTGQMEVQEANRDLAKSYGTLLRRRLKAIRRENGSAVHQARRPTKMLFQWKWPFLKRVDAIEYYRRRRDRALENVRGARQELAVNLFAKASTRGVVVFRNPEVCRAVLRERTLRFNYGVEPAPEPGDIIWENIGVSRVEHRTRRWMAWLVFVLFILIVATPTAVVAMIRRVLEDEGWAGEVAGVFWSLFVVYLPSFLLMIASLLIPIVVEKSTWAEKNYRHSQNEKKMVVRTYVLLLIATLIMPSVSIALISVVLEFLEDSGKSAQALSTAFSPQAQVFFCSYILQQALVGNVIQLYQRGFLSFISQHRAQAMSYEESFVFREKKWYGFWQSTAVGSSVASIAMIYGVFNPVLLLAGLLFMALRSTFDVYLYRSYFLPGDSSTSKHSLSTFSRRYRGLSRICSSGVVVMTLYLFLYYLSLEQATAGLRAFTGVFVLLSALFIILAYSDNWRISRLFGEPPWEVSDRSVGSEHEMRIGYICPYLLDVPPYRSDQRLAEAVKLLREEPSVTDPEARGQSLRQVYVSDHVRESTAGKHVLRAAPMKLSCEGDMDS